MLDRRLSLNDWLLIPGNVEAYRAWINNPTGQTVLELVERECRPQPIKNVPTGQDMGPIAIHAHAQLEGMNRVLQRISQADLFIRDSEAPDVMADGERRSLIEQGYTESEINELDNAATGE